MKVLLATVALLMLSSLAVAAPEAQQLGPYAVSFNMNTDMQYQVQTAEPVETELATYYQMRIFTDNLTAATIALSESKELTDATPEMHKGLMGRDMAYLGGLNITNIEDISIDGKDGFMITAVPLQGNTALPPETKIYQAMYWLDSQECDCGPVSVGKTSVTISSSYPQDVTMGLLDSLHVEKGQAAAGKDMPPAQ